MVREADLPEVGRRDLPPEMYTLPAEFGDDLQITYDVIVHNLRLEAQHLDLTTVQELLVERIAFNYCALRHRERTDGFTHEAAQRQLNSFWLDMTKEFNRLIQQNRQSDRDALVIKVAGIVRDVISQVSDQHTRRELTVSFQDAFDKAEI